MLRKHTRLFYTKTGADVTIRPGCIQGSKFSKMGIQPSATAVS